jgi:hypothetical protein
MRPEGLTGLTGVTPAARAHYPDCSITQRQGRVVMSAR